MNLGQEKLDWAVSTFWRKFAKLYLDQNRKDSIWWKHRLESAMGTRPGAKWGVGNRGKRWGWRAEIFPRLKMHWRRPPRTIPRLNYNPCVRPSWRNTTLILRLDLSLGLHCLGAYTSNNHRSTHDSSNTSG